MLQNFNYKIIIFMDIFKYLAYIFLYYILYSIYSILICHINMIIHMCQAKNINVR